MPSNRHNNNDDSIQHNNNYNNNNYNNKEECTSYKLSLLLCQVDEEEINNSKIYQQKQKQQQHQQQKQQEEEEMKQNVVVSYLLSRPCCNGKRKFIVRVILRMMVLVMIVLIGIVMLRLTMTSIGLFFSTSTMTATTTIPIRTTSETTTTTTKFYDVLVDPFIHTCITRIETITAVVTNRKKDHHHQQQKSEQQQQQVSPLLSNERQIRSSFDTTETSSTEIYRLQQQERQLIKKSKVIHLMNSQQHDNGRMHDMEISPSVNAMSLKKKIQEEKKEQQKQDDILIESNVLQSPILLNNTLMVKNSDLTFVWGTVGGGIDTINYNTNRQHAIRQNLTAMIHIGPQKTGTSSIQVLMNRYVLNLLYEDHYERVPDVNVIVARSFTGCFVQKKKVQYRTTRVDNHCYNDTLRNPIPIATQRSNHLIISSETLADSQVNNELLRLYLLQYWNHLHVVAYYRRYDEWIISLHNQLMKLIPVPEQIPLHTYLNNVGNLNFIYETYYVFGAVRRFQQHFQNQNEQTTTDYDSIYNTSGSTSQVDVYNMHALGEEEEDVVIDNDNSNGASDKEQKKSSSSMSVITHFFCKALIPSSPLACERTRIIDEETNGYHLNSALPETYTSMAHYAYQYGYITNPNTDLRHVSELLYERQRTVLQLPDNVGYHEKYVDCPDENSIHFLWNLTITAEKELFPIYYKQRGSDEIKQQFEKKKVEKKFCHINTEKLLQPKDTTTDHKNEDEDEDTDDEDDDDPNHWKEYILSLKL